MSSTSSLAVYQPVSKYYYIKSQLNPSNVLEIYSRNHEARSYITVGEKKSGVDSWHQQWYLEDAGGGHVYLISRLNGLVLDIKSASRSEGAYLISFPRNAPPLSEANQKWKIGEDGFITSQLNGQVLDVKGASIKPGAYVVMYKRKGSNNKNQQWIFEPVSSEPSHPSKPQGQDLVQCSGGQMTATGTKHTEERVTKSFETLTVTKY